MSEVIDFKSWRPAHSRPLPLVRHESGGHAPAVYVSPDLTADSLPFVEFAPSLEDPKTLLGKLRVELRVVSAPLFSVLPHEYQVEAIEMVGTYVKIKMRCADLEELRSAVAFCRSAAKARRLSFEIHNHLDAITFEEMGVLAGELAMPTI